LCPLKQRDNGDDDAAFRAFRIFFQFFPSPTCLEPLNWTGRPNSRRCPFPQIRRPPRNFCHFFPFNAGIWQPAKTTEKLHRRAKPIPRISARETQRRLASNQPNWFSTA
jgi:hypothetical protein